MVQVTTRRLTVVAVAFLMAFAVAISEAKEQGLLHIISKDGEPRGFLLGTVHSDDPRVLNFSEQFIDALKSSDRFAMELVPNQPTLTRLMDFMHYSDGSTLVSRIGPDRYAGVLEPRTISRERS